MKSSAFVILVLILTLHVLCCTLNAQSSETVLGTDARFDSMWSLELKSNSIQKEIGSLISIYWGTAINRTVIFGFGGSWNLTHTVTNYGCFQLLAQYVQEPDKLLHYGGQLVFGFATVKDYQNPKTGMFDNFMNTSGTSFYMLEPGLNTELNLTKSEKLVLGLGYCFAFGLNELDRSIAASKVTNKDLSGMNITLGVKIGEY